MGGVVDWIDSLPLLPAGNPLFEALPAGAVVLQALAPAIGEGLITMADDDRTGVIVIRAGRIAEVVTFDGAHSTGDAALQSMSGWDAALVSACRLSEAAMSILAPMISGERCYDDLRLEWTRWSELLDDLRSRGDTYVVELRTAAGRGVTVIRGGEQVATYTDDHPSLGEPSLIAALADAGTGTVRVTIGSETSERVRAVAAVAAPVAPGAADGERIVATTLRELVPTDTESHMPYPDVSASPMMPQDTTGSARNRGKAPPMQTDDPIDGDATLTAMFGHVLSARPFTPVVVLAQPEDQAATSVASLLPELKRLVQQRLQRSAGRVEDIVDAAADGGESVAWLADRVRVMNVRGFMTSTLEQLAHEMLALTRD